ncbi:MAG: T9SS type A sorting domain-containing protein [Bacteroidota bacterium]
MKKLLFLFLLLPLINHSQSIFEKTYGGSSFDAGYSFVYDDMTPGYWIAGETESYGSGGKDIYLILINLQGDTLWTKTIGTAGDEVANSATDYNAPAKGVQRVISGYNTNIDKDLYFAEYYYDGMIMYPSKSIDWGYGDDELIKVRSLNFGATQAVGYVTNVNYNKDIFIGVMEDNYMDFDTTMTYSYGGIGDDVAYDITMDYSGNYTTAGYTTSYGSGDKNIQVFSFTLGAPQVKSDSLFDRNYGGSGDESAVSIIYDDYYYAYMVAGYTDSYGLGGKDFYLLRLDETNGDTIWTKTYGNIYDDEPFGMVRESDSTWVIYGYTTNPATMDKDMYILTINLNGDIKNEVIFGEPYIDEVIYDLQLTQCEYLITGVKDEDVYFAQRNKIDLHTIFNDISCFGAYDASIEINPTGGDPNNFEINWMNSAYTTIGVDTNFIDSLVADIYYLMYQELTNYCSINDTFIVTEPSLLILNTASLIASCGGSCDGEAYAIPSGGTLPYEYLWDANAGNQIDSTANSLCAGDFYVTLTDAHGCQEVNNAIVDEKAMGYISGYVNATSYGYIPDSYCIVYLLKEEAFAVWDTMATEYLTGSQYVFDYVYPGDYMIKYELDPSLGYNNVLDSYHDTSFTWTTANLQNISCEDTIYINSTMYEMTPMGNGTGTINGFIAYYDNSKSNGEPVPGAEVYIEQEPNDQPISFSETDTAGFYQFDSIPVGDDYLLFVDIPGFPLISTYTHINVTNSDTLFANRNFYVDTTSGSEGIYVDIPTYFNNSSSAFTYNIYPNPFSEMLNIEYYLNEKSVVEIEIYDSNGKILYNCKEIEQFEGKYLKTINICQTGIYFIKLSVNQNVLVKRVASIIN